MRFLIKKILEKKLKTAAARILLAHQPRVIGITGSVGKTSTKEAIFHVLKGSFRIRQSDKNYNNEIGVPLTVIGSRSAGRSALGWFKVFAAARRAARPHAEYPEILVIEMGADKPGDIEYLAALAPCHIGVITSVGSSHLEFFKTQAGIVKEKRKLIESLPASGWAVLNADDGRVMGMKQKTQARIVTYGFLPAADVRASESRVARLASGNLSTSFKLHYRESMVPVILPHVLGDHLIYPVLAAITVGLIHDVPLLTIIERLKDFTPPAGRMRVLGGIKQTTLIDDTYNSSPEAAIAALKVLQGLEGRRRIAVLGDMLELGSESEAAHRLVGDYVSNLQLDILITVGERSQDTARSAHERGMRAECIFEFGDAQSAGQFLQRRMESGDVILIKGSQGVRMERVVKEVMAEPQRASEFLVRQGREWR